MWQTDRWEGSGTAGAGVPRRGECTHARAAFSRQLGSRRNELAKREELGAGPTWTAPGRCSPQARCPAG